ncbi:sodium:calcium antiporter [Fulvimarina endophytica]|uniref:Sodium:calcium antiporter n=1 Tax=Fulvimarina endophytica TaxID=2293836 RepID=A0A371WYA2_9HYPH|nr:sodium:calcium antiporter [Fulvimarina endophytica]
MAWDLLLLASGLALLVAGGEGLVRGSTDLAARLGLSKLIVGLVILGFGTSAPELLVSIQAALAGSPAISIGNVVGSNIANVLLIIGLVALIAPLPNRDPAIRRDAAVTLAASIVIVLLFLTGTIDRIAGFLLFGALLVYVAVCYVLETRRARASAQGDEAVETASMSPLLAGVAVVAGVAMLVFSARFMVDGATGIARDLGISEAVVGLTIVAIGTSLPELATAIVAARKNESELVLGNVFGSCIFNILCILGITAIIMPIPVDERFAFVDGPVMIAVAAASAVYLFTRGVIGRKTGAAMLLAYGGYLVAQAGI